MPTVSPNNHSSDKVTIKLDWKAVLALIFLWIIIMIPFVVPKLRQWYDHKVNQNLKEKVYKNKYGEDVYETDKAKLERVPGKGFIITPKLQ